MIETIIPWVQLGAVLVAITVAVQSIRSTTAALRAEIVNLNKALTLLQVAIGRLEDRVLDLEKQEAYERGRRIASTAK